MRRPRLLVSLSVTAALFAAVAVVPAVARPAAPAAVPGLKAGVGVADATWRVGAGSGQYTEKNPNAVEVAQGGDADPNLHSNSQQKSYGVHSRLSYRALVLEGADGRRIALVKSDSYLAQDLVSRRAAQLLAAGPTGITVDDILLMASHNHSSPYYSTPAAGVWLFQDAMELRAFEYQARALAEAITKGAAALAPARMGGTTVTHRIYKGNIAGGTVADDGAPGGYPDDYADFGLSVMRFERTDGTPIGVFVNHGQHPESNDPYDLITGDYIAPLERMVERDLGAPLVFSQGDVGSAEGPYDRPNNEVLPDGVRRAWAHVGPAQTERGARYLADTVVAAWNELGRGGGLVPMSSDVQVDALTAWVPGPVSHPYPSVSNCRTEETTEGNPGVPVIGMPDCGREVPGELRGPLAPAASQLELVRETMKAEGIPVPDSYDAPSYGAVQENARIKLQVFRIGEVVLASCSCEAQMDLILNLESRLDDVSGNIRNGFDWSLRCTAPAAAGGTWTCPRPGGAEGQTITVPDAAIQRMKAQVNNDARGWDAPQNAAAAGSEPDDTTKIWGNFTKEELPSAVGYAMPIGVGHAGDYTGYTVSYREYVSRDHYRKALTAYGPHSADYFNTRLVRMAGELAGGPAFVNEVHAPALAADAAKADALARALGEAGAAELAAWEASLPDDAGTVAPLQQPAAQVQRFSAATFAWRGGSNAVDNPVVRVERRQADGSWARFADQTGEVQTMVTWPQGVEGVADARTGAHEWRWTASFEAFSAFPAAVVPGGQTPLGEYRFVVDGNRRAGGATVAYHLESSPFTVVPFQGVTATDVRTEPDGSVSFAATSAYPRTYTSPFRFVRDDGRTTICRTCSFRPWASSAPIVSATVELLTAAGEPVGRVAAQIRDGRVVVEPRGNGVAGLRIPAGGLVDAFGETNGAPITLAG